MFWCFDQSAEALKFCFPFAVNRSLTHVISASIMAVVSILIGFAPGCFYWQSSSRNAGFSAHAEDLSESQINKYAKAALNIEGERQQAYSNIQSILGKNPPDIICNQPETIRKLVPEAQKVAVNYCIKAKKFVENSGLTVSEFNGITQKIRANQTLENLIGQTMLKLKNSHP